jgi:hypothetical protein
VCRDYSTHPCASPLRGGLWPFKIIPDDFVERLGSRSAWISAKYKKAPKGAFLYLAERQEAQLMFYAIQ